MLWEGIAKSRLRRGHGLNGGGAVLAGVTAAEGPRNAARRGGLAGARMRKLRPYPWERSPL